VAKALPIPKKRNPWLVRKNVWGSVNREDMGKLGPQEREREGGKFFLTVLFHRNVAETLGPGTKKTGGALENQGKSSQGF